MTRGDRPIPVLVAAPKRLLYLRDWVYGGIDGAVTTFAVVAGVAGAALEARIVLILGFANLVADGFSMAAGSFSSSRTETEEYDRLLRDTQRRIAEDPEREREALRSVIAGRGFASEQLDELVEAISSRAADWARTLLVGRDGLVPVVRSPLRAAISTYAAFLVCGIVPLLPYVLVGGFATSAVATAAVFFAIGSLKSRWTDRAWWRSGFGTLAIGATAATIAYLIGYGLRLIVGDAPT